MCVERSIDGNLPHIQSSITALPDDNPTWLDLWYCLFESEISAHKLHHINCLKNLMKGHQKTPECSIRFITGSLGATHPTETAFLVWHDHHIFRQHPP